MKYNLTTQSKNGDIIKYVYDAHKNIIMDESGTSILDKVDSKQTLVNPISPDNPGKKGKISVLKIQLGLKCNFSCSYCLQSSEIKDSTMTSNKDASQFLEDLDSWLTSDPTRIEFWGGEPFVYWSKLKILIPELRTRFPNASFLIITNGSLLDDEKIDFILEHKIGIGVSHDGPQQKFRGPDPLKDQKISDCIRRLANQNISQVSFNVVLHSKNFNLNEIYDWFNERFPNPNLSLEGVVAVYDDYTLNNIGQFTKQQYTELVDIIFYEIVNHKRYNTLNLKLQSFVESLRRQTHIGTLTQKCGMDREDMIAVDLLGNVMTCQNTGSKGNHKIGSVYDYENIKLDTSTHFSFREECMHCPVVQLCKGSCMYLYEDNFAQTCWNEYFYNLGVFKAALFLLTGNVLINIEGDIRRPEYSAKTLEKNPALLELYSNV